MLRNNNCQLEASTFFWGETEMNQVTQVFNRAVSYYSFENKELKKLHQNFEFSIILYSTVSLK